MLVLAAIASRILPFKWLVRPGSRDRGRTTVTVEEAAIVARAIDAAARRLPWPSACIERGFGAWWMLRRHGRHATLFYGARLGASEALAAHVWVRSGPTDVIGCDELETYGVLARFPPQHDEST